MTWLLEILSQPGECYDLAPCLGSFFSPSGCGTPNDSKTSAQPDSGLWRKPKARWASAHAPAGPHDETLKVLRKVNPREQRSAFTPWGLTCSEGHARQCITKCNNSTAWQMAFVTAKELLVLRKRKPVFWLSGCGQLKETYNSMNQNIITTESSQRGEGVTQRLTALQWLNRMSHRHHLIQWPLTGSFEGFGVVQTCCGLGASEKHAAQGLWSIFQWSDAWVAA